MYLEGLSEIINAQGEALEAEDIEAYRIVGAESRTLYCDAIDDMCADMMLIAGTFFSDSLGGCD